MKILVMLEMSVVPACVCAPKIKRTTLTNLMKWWWNDKRRKKNNNKIAVFIFFPSSYLLTTTTASPPLPIPIPPHSLLIPSAESTTWIY